MEADEYSNFLTSILSLMTTRRWVPKDGKDGELVLRTVWQDDREVMRGHYAHRRQMGHAQLVARTPATLAEDSARSAARDHPTAQAAAATQHGVRHGGLRRPLELAAGRPKDERVCCTPPPPGTPSARRTTTRRPSPCGCRTSTRRATRRAWPRL